MMLRLMNSFWRMTCRIRDGVKYLNTMWPVNAQPKKVCNEHVSAPFAVLHTVMALILELRHNIHCLFSQS
jgi:hypothetical protein